MQTRHSASDARWNDTDNYIVDVSWNVYTIYHWSYTLPVVIGAAFSIHITKNVNQYNTHVLKYIMQMIESSQP